MTKCIIIEQARVVTAIRSHARNLRWARSHDRRSGRLNGCQDHLVGTALKVVPREWYPSPASVRIDDESQS